MKNLAAIPHDKFVMLIEQYWTFKTYLEFIEISSYTIVFDVCTLLPPSNPLAANNHTHARKVIQISLFATFSFFIAVKSDETRLQEPVTFGLESSENETISSSEPYEISERINDL